MTRRYLRTDDGRLIQITPPRLRVFKHRGFWTYQVDSPGDTPETYRYEQRQAVSWPDALELGLRLAGLT